MHCFILRRSTPTPSLLRSATSPPIDGGEERRQDFIVRLWSLAQRQFEDRIGAERAAKLRAMLDEVAALDLEMPAAAPLR